jgi:hypothetical protein
MKIAHFFPIGYQTWGLQSRRLKCEKLTDDRQQVMPKAHIAFGKVS